MGIGLKCVTPVLAAGAAAVAIASAPAAAADPPRRPAST
jgi:thiamine monophosphate synthase